MILRFSDNRISTKTIISIPKKTISSVWFDLSMSKTLVTIFLFQIKRKLHLCCFRELNPSRWLEAHCDQNADLTTLPNNLVLAGTNGDGEHRLVLSDLNLKGEFSARLKVYKGTVLSSDQALPDIPSGIISFYVDNLQPKLPGEYQ